MLQELNGWVRRVTPLDEVVFVDIIGKANGKATDRHETVTFRASNAAAYDAWCKLPDIDDNVVHVQLAGTWREKPEKYRQPGFTRGTKPVPFAERQFVVRRVTVTQVNPRPKTPF
jgi:hypothetical protein